MIFNFVDKITAFTQQKTAIGEKIITTAQLPYMTANALYPMLLIEAVGQLNAWITMEMNNFQVRPIAILYGEINIYGTAAVGDRLIIETELTRFDETTSLFNGRVKLADKILIEVIDAAGSFLDINEFAFAADYRDMFTKLIDEQLIDCFQNPLIEGLFDFDEIKYISAEKISASKYIQHNYPFFNEHFPKKPILPISVLLQNNIELGKSLISRNQLSDFEINKIQLSKIKMRDFIFPNSILSTKIELIENQDDYFYCRFDNIIQGRSICRGAIKYFNKCKLENSL